MLRSFLNTNQYSFPEEKIKQFSAYLELLQKWNRVFNLTSITEMAEMIPLHLLDSLSISPYLHGNRIIDVGTGAGLPGIPLAIVHPEKSFTLLDSNGKKTRFLMQAKAALHLNNVDIIHSRCEDFHPAEYFDSILSRAFASLREMVIATQHLLNPQGQFLAMKGVYPETEINELPPEFKVSAIHTLKIQGLSAERHLVCIEHL